MSVQEQARHVGDTSVAVAATLVRPDDSVVDLTDLTVSFKMLDSEGTAKVAKTTDNVTVTDAEAGQCQYDLQTADVDTEGTFYAYFIVGDGGDDTFPVERGEFRIRFMPDI